MADIPIAIIGAGVAGLSAGIYAQMNGYQTEIFEMNDYPGGLCTSWKRKGYTIDGCVRWLIGSSQKSLYHHYLQEVGIVPGRSFIYLDEFLRFEVKEALPIIFYTDLTRLKEHLYSIAPEDRKLMDEWLRGMQALDRLTRWRNPSWQGNWQEWLRSNPDAKLMRYWRQISIDAFVKQLRNPALREAFADMFYPPFSMLFLMLNLAYIFAGEAGYPLGGSHPLAEAMAQRYKNLGGRIHYRSKVTGIGIKEHRASSIKLKTGEEITAERIISAVDAHSTFFRLLNGTGEHRLKYAFQKWPLFPGLIYVGLGVGRDFASEPQVINGINFPLSRSVNIAGIDYRRMRVQIYNYDHHFAPEGKTLLVVKLPCSYDYWKKFGRHSTAYQKEKERVAEGVIRALSQRFPGLESQLEMVNVATPLTFEHFTGNWRGSYEGWMLTPVNAYTLIRPLPHTLNGVKRFYLCGQWLHPGGGLIISVASGRMLIEKICREDGKIFHTIPV